MICGKCGKKMVLEHHQWVERPDYSHYYIWWCGCGFCTSTYDKGKVWDQHLREEWERLNAPAPVTPVTAGP